MYGARLLPGTPMTPPPEYHDAAGHPLALGDFVAFEPYPPALGLAVGRLAGVQHRLGQARLWYVVWGYWGVRPMVESRANNQVRWLNPAMVPASTRTYLHPIGQISWVQGPPL